MRLVPIAFKEVLNEGSPWQAYARPNKVSLIPSYSEAVAAYKFLISVRVYQSIVTRIPSSPSTSFPGLPEISNPTSCVVQGCSLFLAMITVVGSICKVATPLRNICRPFLSVLAELRSSYTAMQVAVP